MADLAALNNLGLSSHYISGFQGLYGIGASTTEKIVKLVLESSVPDYTTFLENPANSEIKQRTEIDNPFVQENIEQVNKIAHEIQQLITHTLEAFNETRKPEELRRLKLDDMMQLIKNNVTRINNLVKP